VPYVVLQAYFEQSITQSVTVEETERAVVQVLTVSAFEGPDDVS
jgi:hypothetical protein